MIKIDKSEVVRDRKKIAESLAETVRHEKAYNLLYRVYVSLFGSVSLSSRYVNSAYEDIEIIYKLQYEKYFPYERRMRFLYDVREAITVAEELQQAQVSSDTDLQKVVDSLWAQPSHRGEIC